MRTGVAKEIVRQAGLEGKSGHRQAKPPLRTSDPGRSVPVVHDAASGIRLESPRRVDATKNAVDLPLHATDRAAALQRDVARRFLLWARREGFQHVMAAVLRAIRRGRRAVRVIHVVGRRRCERRASAPGATIGFLSIQSRRISEGGRLQQFVTLSRRIGEDGIMREGGGRHTTKRGRRSKMSVRESWVERQSWANDASSRGHTRVHECVVRAGDSGDV